MGGRHGARRNRRRGATDGGRVSAERGLPTIFPLRGARGRARMRRPIRAMSARLLICDRGNAMAAQRGLGMRRARIGTSPQARAPAMLVRVLRPRGHRLRLERGEVPDDVEGGVRLAELARALGDVLALGLARPEPVRHLCGDLGWVRLEDADLVVGDLRDVVELLPGDVVVEDEREPADEALGDGAGPCLGDDAVARAHPLHHVAHKALRVHGHAPLAR
mmetsp:Transcript_7954/g.32288  ORF Transcript_7954/g.32288 Transcript_7954/m.32288 type:complete len:220 (-) Transcript_7954:859-1518(-)